MIYLSVNTIEEKTLAEKLYNKYSKFMFKTAYYVLKNNFLAEDAVQQAFIKIIKNLDKIDENNENKTRNFIGLITKNTAIDIYNKTKNQPICIDEIYFNEKSCDISQLIINKEIIARLKVHIKELKPAYQIPLLLNAEQGLSVNEIAEILNLKPKTVQKRIERARTKLINALNKEEN